MSSEPPPPALALDDIIHLTTPSPAKVNFTSVGHNDEPRSLSPEPLSDSERASFVKRISELGSSIKDSPSISARERELVEMVLRLTNDTPPDRSQLFSQADIIASLTSQRDFLIKQAEEQRSRWEAEADGWARMAEALIAQRNKSDNPGAKGDDLERQCASFESDNKALRDKLAETQSRLATLESELTKLRPLLLMQLTSAIPSAMLSAAATPSKQKTVQMRKKRDKIMSSTSGPDDQQVIDLESGPTVEDTALPPRTPGHYSTPNSTEQTRIEDSQLRKRMTKRDKVSKSSTVPLMSDARAEHLLLAARKIGRQRVEMLSKLKAAETKESGDSRTASPKTPKRPSAQLQPQPSHATPHRFALASQAHTPHGFVFVNNAMGLSPTYSGSPVHPQFLIPVAGYPPIRTPSRSFDKSSTPGLGTSPQTPLDSLLSAARSMMDSGESTPRANGVSSNNATGESNRKTRRAGVVEMPESPVPPKRRRVAGGTGLVRRTQSQARAEVNADVAEVAETRRVKSALDVLADQAAVFSSNDQRSKGKEKKDDAQHGIASPTSTAYTKGAGEKEGKGKDRVREVRPLKVDLDDDLGDEPRIISEAAAGNDSFLDASRSRAVVKPPGWLSEDGDSLDNEWPAGSSPRPLASRERESTSRARSFNSRGHRIATHSNVQSAEEKQDEEDENYLDSCSLQTETLMSLETPSKPRSRTPVSPPADQDPWDDGNPIPSEERREHHPDVTTPQRATSTSLSATPRDIDREVHLESGAQGRSLIESSSPDIVVTLETDAIPKESSTTDVGINEESAQTADDSVVSRDPARVSKEQDMPIAMPGKRPRSPYVKWSKEEDDLLAQAVAKYGQKWDQVQKALPSRGYHQVRQRWLRKLGMFDNKSDHSMLNTSNFPVLPTTERSVDSPKLRLGLAPLSSELCSGSVHSSIRETDSSQPSK